MYLIVICIIDSDSINCVFDFFVYLAHFQVFVLIGAFRRFFSEYSNKKLLPAFNQNLTSDIERRYELIYRCFTKLQVAYILFFILTMFVFWDCSATSLSFIHFPGLRIFVEVCQAKNNLTYHYRTATKIDEKFLSKSMLNNLTFKTLETLVPLLTYRAVFLKTGFSVSFCFVHLIFIVRAFHLAFSWMKEFGRYRTFRRHQGSIREFPLVHAEEEDCVICMNKLSEGRQLPCGHKYHQ